ncbi:hypothetical protein A7P53_07540 [Acinetobacter defluvii]|nr:hypothetical protein [Acinetobacter defluvii]
MLDSEIEAFIFQDIVKALILPLAEYVPHLFQRREHFEYTIKMLQEFPLFLKRGWGGYEEKCVISIEILNKNQISLIKETRTWLT